jgi:hypothetical protein
MTILRSRLSVLLFLGAGVAFVWAGELATRHLCWDTVDNVYWLFAMVPLLIGVAFALPGVLLRSSPRPRGRE